MASVRNCWTMSRRTAPIALRMPISRVRSVTDTSMMFITPTPPTRRAIDEMKSIASVMPPVMALKFPISLSGVMIPKSLGLLNGTLRRDAQNLRFPLR